MACGTPVLAADIGSAREMIDAGRTGFLFQAGEAKTLASAMEEAFGNPDQLADMRYQARTFYEERFAALDSYDALWSIYQNALGAA